jgi:hypothetical protein
MLKAKTENKHLGVIYTIHLPLFWLAIFSLVIFLPINSGAIENSGIPAAFLDVGLGAGPMGLGGTDVGLGRDVYSIINNPAGLISINSQEAAFSMTKQFSLVPYNMLLYGYKLNKKMAVGAGFITAGDASLRENSLILCYSQFVPYGISVGANFKLRLASYGNNSDGEWVYDGGNRQVKGSAKGIGFDIGARGILGKRLGYGIVLKDLFESISYDASNDVETANGGSETVPVTLQLGAGYVVTKDLTFEADLNKVLYKDLSDRFSFGMENVLFSMLLLRAGFSQNINAEETNRNYFIGLGVEHEIAPANLKAGLDFAYIINEFQNFYHLGLKVSFGSK